MLDSHHIYNKHFIKRLFFILIILIISLYLLSSFYLVFKTDEEVSIGLVQKKFIDIIKIDSLDVHPPFYYLFLKLFLVITTFWSRSLFIKVIFARVFSLIFLILFFIYIIKIIKYTGIHINYEAECLLILMSPGVINESAKIRMYSLAAFLITFELYEILVFINKHNVKDFVFVILSASLASYTFYPLAVSAGLMLLMTFIYEWFHHRKISFLMLISGICFLIMYIPWIKIIVKQFNMHSGSDSSLVPNYFYVIVDSITQINAPNPKSALLKYSCFISLVIISLFILLIYYSLKNLNKTFNKVLMMVLINFLSTLIISIFFCKRQFRVTIMYPDFSIMISLLICVAILYVKYNYNYKIFNILLTCSLVIFVLYSSAAFLNNMKHYDIPSIQLVSQFSKWQHTNCKSINIDKASYIKEINGNIIGNPTYVSQDSIYLQSINKNADINVKKNKGEQFMAKGLFNNKFNTLLNNKLFPNLRYKN